MSIKYERAQQRTRGLIVMATMELLQEIGYDALNVTRIANRADIGRGTFYRYFADVDAVIMLMLQLQMRQMYAAVDDVLSRHESPLREKLAWQVAFQHLDRLRPIISRLQGPRALALWEQIAVHGLSNFTQSLAKREIRYTEWMDLPVDMMAHFTSGALWSVIRGWFNGTLQYSADEMGTMVYRLLYHPGE